jgi:hypothetical protein
MDLILNFYAETLDVIKRYVAGLPDTHANIFLAACSGLLSGGLRKASLSETG